MNPGGGPMGGLGPADQQQYRALEGVRDADDRCLSARFDELTAILAEIMPEWKIHRNFVVPVLEAAGLAFSEVAFVNLLKWRTNPDTGLARLYRLSWQHHTQEQIELLAPYRVIAIGADAGRAFQKHYGKPVDFDFIPLVIGGNVGPDGRAALARIAEAVGR